MTARTIVINADTGWNFRELLHRHALDLYPAHKEVLFWGVDNPDTSQSPNAKSVWGAFPEEFHTDPDSLLDELKEAFLWVTANDTKFLSVVVLLSEEDIRSTLARNGRPSDAASAAMHALTAFLKDLSGYKGNGGAIAPQRTRIWTAVAARDLGHDPRHDGLIDQLHRRLSLRNSSLNTVFGLSNGKDLNDKKRSGDNFAKLRYVIEIMRAETNNQGRRLRKSLSDTLHATPDRYWVRTPETLTLPVSQAIRDCLLQLSRVAAVTPRRMEDFDEASERDIEDFALEMSEIRKMIRPELREEHARARIENMLSQAPALSDQSGVPRDREDVGAVIDELKHKADQGWPRLLYNASRAEKINRFERDFEPAFSHAAQHFDSAVDQGIKAEKLQRSSERMKLVARVERLKTPMGKSGQRVVNAQLADLAQEIASDAQEATRLRERHIETAHRSTQGASERGRAFDALYRTEVNLLRVSALRTPFLVLGMFLIPVLVSFGGFVAGGGFFNAGWQDFLDLAGPFWYVPSFGLLFALLSGVLTAIRLSGFRKRASQHVMARLEADWKALQRAAASRMAAVATRSRASDRRLIISKLEKPPRDTNTLEVHKALATLRNADSIVLADEGDLQSLKQDILEKGRENYNSGRYQADQMQKFLAGTDVKIQGTMTLQLPYNVDLQLPCSFHTGAELAMTEVGYDRH